MRKSRFKEEQIIAVVKELDAGAKPADLVRRLGVTETTLVQVEYFPDTGAFGVMVSSRRSPPPAASRP